MSVKIEPAMGWKRVLILANKSVELLITLDVGPRIISYRRQQAKNVFKTFEEQLGKYGETTWQTRGGHRLWIAPETPSTYFADNQPVSVNVLNEHHVRLTTPVEIDSAIKKDLEIVLDEKTSRVTVNHGLTAAATLVEAIAPWALSVFRPGGKAIVPMPRTHYHPNDIPENKKAQKDASNLDLLPNRSLSLWGYTNITDPRFNWLEEQLEVKQDTNMASTKLGFLHKLKVAHYEIDSCRFSKTISYDETANYPDGNCNLEIFTDSTMLELESLGPLVSLSEDEKIVHTEEWSLEKL